MKALRIAIALALVAGLALGTIGCSDKDVAAKVNGEIVKKSELDAQVAKLKEQYPNMFDGADGEGRLLDFKQRLLDNMINQVLIKQAAKEKGIKVTDKAIDEKVAELKQGFESEEQFASVMQQSGMDIDTLREQIREQLINEQIVATLTDETKVSDAEIKEYYEGNKSTFAEQAAVHVAHILFEAADKATAEKVLGEVKTGGNFGALAKEYSKDAASAANGGDLGWPTSAYVPEFQAAAEKLQPGQISDLVQSQYGYHIIKMIEKRENRQKTLDEVKGQVEQIILGQRKSDAYQKFLNELRDNAVIEILVPELQKPATAEGDAAK